MPSRTAKPVTIYTTDQGRFEALCACLVDPRYPYALPELAIAGPWSPSSLLPADPPPTSSGTDGVYLVDVTDGGEALVRRVAQHAESQPASLWFAIFPDRPTLENVGRGAAGPRAVLLADPLDYALLRQMMSLHFSQVDIAERGRRLELDLAASNRALDRAKREVEAAETAKNEFMANVSHEIRTPLNAVLGFSKLLMDEPLSPSQHEKLGYVHDAGRGLLRVIEQMLDFARLRGGELRLRPLPFDFANAVDESIERFTSAANEKGLHLAWHVDPAIPRLLVGDSGRLSQVLDALVDNAIRFTPRGEVFVQAASEGQSERHHSIRITISDTGVGIPAERQAVVFRSFSQVDGSATRRVNGMGLSLAICRQLVELMNGEIGFRSDDQQGSTFWFTATFETSHDPRFMAAAQERNVAPCGSRAGSSAPRVLAVDLDHLTRTALEMIFSRIGAMVEYVSAEAADANIAADGYELAFLSAEGDAALARLARLTATPQHPPLVAVVATTATARHCLRLGCDACLTIPPSSDELLELAMRFLPRLVSEPEAAAESSLPDPIADRVEHCLESLRRAIDAQKFESLESQARQLRVAACDAGLNNLADEAMRLQLAARAADLPRAVHLVRMMQNAAGLGHYDNAAALNHPSHV